MGPCSIKRCDTCDTPDWATERLPTNEWLHRTSFQRFEESTNQGRYIAYRRILSASSKPFPAAPRLYPHAKPLLQTISQNNKKILIKRLPCSLKMEVGWKQAVLLFLTIPILELKAESIIDQLTGLK